MADEVSEENPRKKIRLDESARPTQRNENSAETDIEKEMRLGIASYTNRAVSGFSGILKQRYTDFLVNEILLSGKVLHLEDVDGSEKTVDPNVSNQSFNSNAEPPATLPLAEEKVEVPSLPIQVWSYGC
jgi:tRNA pseudouridine13 synthase